MEPSREELIEKRDGEDCKQWNTQMRCDWEKKGIFASEFGIGIVK